VNKQLYTVRLEHTLIVLAHTPAEATFVAVESLGDLDMEDFLSEAQPLRSIPEGYDDDLIPFEWDPDEDITLKEWIARGAAPEYKKEQ